MASELLDRAARALYEQWTEESLEDDWIAWERLPDKETWRDRARAVFKAVATATLAAIERN